MSLYLQTWSLNQELLLSELDLLDNPSSFSKEFSCPDLQSFLESPHLNLNISETRELINEFFDRLLSTNSAKNYTNDKGVYVRLKWLVWTHGIMTRLQTNSPLFAKIGKALKIYIDHSEEIFQERNGFEKYLSKGLMKPYLQFLVKLCEIEEEQHETNSPTKKNNNYIHFNSNKENHNITNISTETSIPSPCSNPLHWYRLFNFISSTLQSLPEKLSEHFKFFSEELPYLLELKRYIETSILKVFKEVKNTNINLQELNMTLIEIVQLENKIKELTRIHHQTTSSKQERNTEMYFDNNEEELYSWSIDNVESFMLSPLKSKRFNIQQ